MDSLENISQNKLNMCTVTLYVKPMCAYVSMLVKKLLVASWQVNKADNGMRTTGIGPFA
jgi:hypothetical protein